MKRNKVKKNKSEEIRWIPIQSILDLLKHPDFYWGAHENFIDLKYLELRVDTRGLHCIMKDRNGKLVDLEKIKRSLPEVRIKEMNNN